MPIRRAYQTNPPTVAEQLNSLNRRNLAVRARSGLETFRAARRNDRNREGSPDDLLAGSRDVVGGAGSGDFGTPRDFGNPDIPPGPARSRALRGIGGDDDDRGAPLGPYLGQRCLEFGKARHFARISAKARGMAGEVDTRAVGEEIVERGAAATALQSFDAAEPAIVEHDDVQLFVQHHR